MRFPVSPPPRAITARPEAATQPRSENVRYDEFQQSVIDSDAALKVVKAKAGAGKTSMAIGYTRKRPDRRFLYLCFNRPNALEAQQRFGPNCNTDCMTSHSLAYRAVGHKFKNRLLKGQWYPNAFARETGCSSVRVAAVAQDILAGFFASSANIISEAHTLAAQLKWGESEQVMGQAIDVAKRAWVDMQSTAGTVSLPHDAYLKMWVLSRPKLTGYTDLILDEAQDTNPVTAQFVAEQQHLSRLLIGDPHQSIYLFRGAVNAMEDFLELPGCKGFDLPRTWRFGPGIAEQANTILRTFKGETVDIIGAGPARPMPSTAARTVLSRSNAGLFSEAVAVMGKNVHWVGGIENYKVDLMLDAYHLWSNQAGRVVAPHLRQYRSWAQFESDTEASKDAEARMLKRLVDEHRHNMPRLVQSIKENAKPTAEGARLVLTTAHKSKGLEADHVVLGDDFNCLEDAMSEQMSSPGMPLSPETAQEINLLYVVMTRARHRLDLNEATRRTMSILPAHVSALQEARGRLENQSTPTP